MVNVNTSKYAYECGRVSNVCDGAFIYDAEGNVLNSLNISSSNNILFSSGINQSNHVLYSMNILYGCNNIFGCVGLRNKSYFILNKAYNKDEYEALVSKIIEHMLKTGEWGEFFPPSLSPFGYNETVAQEYFPLNREEVIGVPLTGGLIRGPIFNWSDYEPQPPKADKIITQEMMKKLPDNIKDIPDDILNWALTCEVSGKPYKIIKHELDFYRRHNIPIPRKHPDQRHLDRMKLRNPRKLYQRCCMKCNKSIRTTYAPDRPETIYCEECYNKEVY